MLMFFDMIKIWDWESLFPASQDTTKWEGGPMNCRKCGVALPEKAAFCPACGVKQAVSARKPKRRGNGQGTVVKRGKTYTAICTKFIAGKRITFSKGGFATKKEALDYIPNLKPAPCSVAPKITLKELFERWKPFYSPRVGETTMQGYDAAFHWLQALHLLPFAALSTDDWQGCVDACPRGRRTKENMKSLGMALYKYAATLRVVDHNYAQYIWCGSDTTGTRPPITMEELETIRKAIGREAYADYVYCMCYTGFRPTAFLSLTKTAFDPVNGCLCGGIKTKAGKNRIVTISPKIMPIIQARAACAAPYLFPSLETGKMMTEAEFRNDVFKPLMAKLGIKDRTPYSCRHTFSNLMKNVPGSDTDKAALMGHTDASMTKYYQAPDYESLKRITDLL